MHIAGIVNYDPTSQTTVTSSGPSDVKTVVPPRGADAVAFTLESPPIRITFDGKRPTPAHGLKLSAPEHFFPFARQMKFASVEQGRDAIVSFLWLRLKPREHKA
jgi:hypothetical protein